MDTPVARPAIDGSHPVQFRPICLCCPIGDARSSFSAPFCQRSPLAGRHCSRRSWISKLERCLLTHSHLPRRRGALNTDQGSQFTSTAFTGTLMKAGVAISMDGRGRWMDNVFIERLWRSVKHEDIYLKGYADGCEAKAGIGRWFAFYKRASQHPSVYVVEEKRFC
jgi:Integrase core domain